MTRPTRKPKYAYCVRGDNFTGPFATQEAALAEAAAGEAAGTTISVGEVRPIRITDLLPASKGLAEHLIERTEEHLHEMIGELSETAWAPSEADEEVLDKMLRMAFERWLRARQLRPSAFQVENIVEFTVAPEEPTHAES